MPKSFAVVMLVLALVAAACSSDESDQIQGTWLVSALNAWMELDEGGQFEVAANSDVEEPFETGTYTFDGETFSMTTSTASPNCPDATITWTVVFSANGDEASLTFVEDSCPVAKRSQDVVLIRQLS